MAFAHGFARQVTVTHLSCSHGRAVASAYVGYGFNHPANRSSTLTVLGFRCRLVSGQGARATDYHSKITCTRGAARVTFVEGT